MSEHGGVCDNPCTTARQVIDSQDGEMSEWLKEHAWKANPARLTEQHRNIASCRRCNDLRSQDAP
jgi:hypothetical protein